MEGNFRNLFIFVCVSFFLNFVTYLCYAIYVAEASIKLLISFLFVCLFVGRHDICGYMEHRITRGIWHSGDSRGTVLHGNMGERQVGVVFELAVVIQHVLKTHYYQRIVLLLMTIVVTSSFFSLLLTLIPS